ncbi:phosphohydrolase [bacterium BFN5]|nr:phosphohydrolase [bacterium BFN5]
MRQGDWIETYTGIKFWPLDPLPHEVSLNDIAHALAMLCRANGHCTTFYSVAQHSLNVSKELAFLGYSPRLQLMGLLHDASEAYLSDITRPVKKYLPQYIEIEHKLQTTIFQAFGLIPTAEELEIVSQIDNALLAHEVRTLMKNINEWAMPVELHDVDLTSKPIADIKKAFLSLGCTLLAQVKALPK